MEIEPQTVLVYARPDGAMPFNDWFEQLKDSRAQTMIRTRLARVRAGNFGDCKLVGEGVSELRIDSGPGYRIYFGRHGDKVVILVCGGDKSTQSKDIKTAQRFWADYRKRTNG